MEKYLHDRLQIFNRESRNTYQINWGTALDYIKDSRIQVCG